MTHDASVLIQISTERGMLARVAVIAAVARTSEGAGVFAGLVTAAIGVQSGGVHLVRIHVLDYVNFSVIGPGGVSTSPVARGANKTTNPI